MILRLFLLPYAYFRQAQFFFPFMYLLDMGALVYKYHNLSILKPSVPAILPHEELLP